MLSLFDITSTVGFFWIFLLGFVKQKFKTTSYKKGHIFQTQMGLQKICILCLNVNGLKSVSALTIELYLGNICPFWCNLRDSIA